MRIKAIQVIGEMGDFHVTPNGTESVTVQRLATGEFMKTNSIDKLAVAIDGVGFADLDGAEDLFQMLGVEGK